MAIVLSLVWLGLILWLIWRASQQRSVFPQLPARSPGQPRCAASVAVIVPVRNEINNIGPCLLSVLSQDLPPDELRVVVVDDNSEDGSARIVEQLAAQERRIALVRASGLPSGWTGKAHACWVGARSVPAEIEWLCFLDADMRLQPALLSSALDAAAASELDLLSLTPRHELESFAERLILPCGLYLLAVSQDLAELQSPLCPDAVATGQFMLVRRVAYEEVGGFYSVRSRICEDVALARLLKSHGHRVLLEDGSRLLSTRMYQGWQTLWPGIAKNLSEMLGGTARTLLIATLAVMIAWTAVLLPMLEAPACARGATQACIALVPAVLGSAAAFALHVAGAAHFRIPFWYGLLFPVGYSVGAVIALDSVRWRLTGSVRWKGRVYP
jgi:chlorobactene glucosyltransferase